MDKIIDDNNIEEIDLNNYIGAFVDGYNEDEISKSNPLKIGVNSTGHSTEQEFSTEDLNWRVWDYDGKVLRLISEKPTEQILFLNGAKGYNNGISVLNNICNKCYGKSSIKGVSAANIKRSDIEKISKYKFTDYADESNKFGSTKLFTNVTNCPSMWKNYDFAWKYSNEDDDVDTEFWERDNNYYEEVGVISESNITYKQSRYKHNFGDSPSSDDFESGKEIYYELLLQDGNKNYFDKIYWIGCRFTVIADQDYCAFGFQILDYESKLLSGAGIYQTSGHEIEYGYPIRPIVSINLKESGYKIKKKTNTDGEKVRLELTR